MGCVQSTDGLAAEEAQQPPPTGISEERRQEAIRDDKRYSDFVVPEAVLIDTAKLALRRVSRDLVGIRVDIAAADAAGAGADGTGADAGAPAAAASSPASAASAAGASAALALTPSRRTVKSPRASVTFGAAATAGAEQPAAPADAGNATTTSAASTSTSPPSSSSSSSATSASSAVLPADEPVMKRAGSRMQQNARFTEFDYMEIIGHGDFGLVVRVREKATGTAYAMKIIDKMRALNKFSSIESLLIERHVMHIADHANIVGLRTYFETKHFMFFVMELIHGGNTIDKVISTVGRVPENIARFWVAQLVLALEYLHLNLGVVWRDLKPDNVMIDPAGNVRLIDFGVSALLTKSTPSPPSSSSSSSSSSSNSSSSSATASSANSSSSATPSPAAPAPAPAAAAASSAAPAALDRIVFGPHRRHRSSFGGAGASEEVALAAEETLGNLKAAAGLTQAIGAKGYRAPEMLVPALQPYRFSVDWFNLGVCLHVMLSGGKHPFASTFGELSENIAAGNAPRLSIKLSAHAADLIARLIAFDPANRIGCGAATDDSASALVRTKSGSADSGNESSNSSAGTNINGGTHTGSGSDNGSGRDADAIAAVFAHPFFADIDWDRMRDGELPSPYIAYLQQQQQADGANGVGGDAAVAAIYPALRADEVPKFASAMDVLIQFDDNDARRQLELAFGQGLGL